MNCSLVDVLRQQRESWLAGREVRLEELLPPGAVEELDSSSLLDLIYGEICLQEEFSRPIDVDSLVKRFPRVESDVRRLVELHNALGATVFEEIDDGTSLLQDATPREGLAKSPLENQLEVLKLHAAGGLGEVYLARDRNFRRTVALKRIRADRRSDRRLAALFRREAEITACLEHPGIVPIYAMEESQDGDIGYTMRFIEGRTLREAIILYHCNRLKGQRSARQSDVELRELLRSFVVTCRTIAFAHDRGVVHRDLKPANIIVGDYGETIIVDWGFAVRCAEQAEVGHRDGPVVGTLEYMSPEQAAGSPQAATPSTDIFGLGAVLYSILTGTSPYHHTNPSELHRLAREAKHRPVCEVVLGVPRPLESICRRAMQTHPAERYQSAAELADEVQRWLDDELVLAHGYTNSEQLLRWTRRRQKPLLAALSAAVAAIGVLIWAFSAVRSEQSRTITEQRRSLALAREAEQNSYLAAENTRAYAEQASYLAQVFLAADPIGLAGTGLPVAMDNNRRRLLIDLLKQAEDGRPKQMLAIVDAQISSLYGNLYRSMGDYEHAGQLLNNAHSLLEKESNPAPQLLAEVKHNLAWYEQDIGRYDRAEKLYTEAIKLRLDAGDELAAATTKFHLAWALAMRFQIERPHEQAPLAEVGRLLDEVLATRERLLPENDRLTAITLIARAPLLFSTGRQPEAVESLTKGVQILERRGQSIPLTRGVQYLIMANFHRRGPAWIRNPEEAQKKYELALAEADRVLGDHPLTAMLLGEYAGFLREQGQVQAAEARIKRAIEIGRESMASGHPLMLMGLLEYGKHLRDAGRTTEAEERFQEVLDRGIPHLGPDHVYVRAARALLERP